MGSSKSKLPAQNILTIHGPYLLVKKQYKRCLFDILAYVYDTFGLTDIIVYKTTMYYQDEYKLCATIDIFFRFRDLRSETQISRKERSRQVFIYLDPECYREEYDKCIFNPKLYIINNFCVDPDEIDYISEIKLNTIGDLYKLTIYYLRKK